MSSWYWLMTCSSENAEKMAAMETTIGALSILSGDIRSRRDPGSSILCDRDLDHTLLFPIGVVGNRTWSTSGL
jgi:hypothetical protein